MNALSSLKEFASSVARTKGSARATLIRDPRAKGSAIESVDEQIALLVETLEGEARERHVPERSGAVAGRSAATAAGPRRPHRVRSSSSTGAGVIRPFRKRHQQILLYPSVVLLGAAVGLLVAVVFGR